MAKEAAKKAAEEVRKAREEADRVVSVEAAAALAVQTAVQAGGAAMGATQTGTEDAKVRRQANALKNLELMKSVHGGPKSKGPRVKPSVEAGTSKGPGTAEGGTEVLRTQEVSPLFFIFFIDQCIAQRKRASGLQCRRCTALFILQVAVRAVYRT